jgi:hypothetical protein
MLLLRNDPGDNEKALQLLTEALMTAEALGLTALVDKARLLKLTAAAATPAAARSQVTTIASARCRLSS